MTRIVFPVNLARKVTCPAAEIEASTVAELFDIYFRSYPDGRHYVLDDQGPVRKHVVVLVDGFNLRDRSGLGDPIKSDSEIFVFPALSGG